MPPAPMGHPQIASDFIQICFVVEDLEAAMADYSRIFGAGPWFLYEEPSPNWIVPCIAASRR